MNLPPSRWPLIQKCVIALTAATAVMLFVSKIAAYDLWWHLTAGGEILRTLSVPHFDPFSYTAYGAPWTYHSWLAGVVLHLVHRHCGVAGLILLRAVLIAGSLALMWWAARRRGVGLGLASVIVLAAAFQLQTLALTRPFLFSFALFGVFYLVTEAASRRAAEPPATLRGRRFGAEGWYLWGGGGRLILLPVLTVLWANLHAGFIAGLLLLCAFGAGEMAGVVAQSGARRSLSALLAGARGARFRALAVTGCLCLAASVVTPYGPDILTYPLRLMAQVKLVKEIQEWKPTPLNLNSAVFWAVMGVSIAVFALSAWRLALGRALKRHLGPLCTDVLLMGGFGLLALQSVRNLAWPLLLAAPVLGRYVTLTRADPTGARADAGSDAAVARHADRPYLLLALLVALLLLGRQCIGNPDFGFGVQRGRLPVKACDFLQGVRKGPKWRLFNVYEWGGYLIWRFWPQERVFIDGRCLVYRDPIMGATDVVANGKEGWEEVLDRYEVQAILIRHRHRKSGHFFKTGSWRCIYWDDEALVAVREEYLREEMPEQQLLDLSNPVTFKERLPGEDAAAVLAEVDRVLEVQPDSSTAWTERASCLLRIAAGDEERRRELLAQAAQAANRAVELDEFRSDAWEALAECYEASGDQEAAAKAQRNVRDVDR